MRSGSPNLWGDYSLVDRRLYNFLLAYAYPNLGKQRTHVVRLAEIKRFAASARDGTGEADNRRLKASVVRLQETVVQFNCLNSDGNKIWRSVQLLGQSDLEEATGELSYTFPPGSRSGCSSRLSIAIYRCAQSTSLNRNTD